MRRGVGTLAVLCGVLGACARGPSVASDGLELRRVVVYRNGVGYFEREGRVHTDRVGFRVKGSEIGDFLATLAVIERGGSSVRSASFPIRRAETPGAPPRSPSPCPVENRGPGPEPSLTYDTASTPSPSGTGSGSLETVLLELDGKEHELQVGYIAETPVWRPSYRLVIDHEGSDLQAWGIVQNLSGEDWRNVSLSLIAGAPLAFEATLGTPVIPERPTVTDSGEVIAAVPRSETSLSEEQAALSNQKPAAPPEPAREYGPSLEGELTAAAPAPSTAAQREVAKKSALRRSATGGAADAARPKAAPGARATATAAPVAPPPPAPVARANPSAPRNLSALAAVAVEAGATRYDLPTPVTVPDKSATMVMLLSKRVPGEAIYLYAPDGSVADSQAHPYRVARFTNKSGGLLERGPIAIFEKGAFLGQGMLEPLPVDATTTVPFALERSLAVDVSRAFSEEGARIARIEAGALTLERDAVTRTRYRVKNGSESASKLMVKHPRQPGTRLNKPPKGTEDNVGTDTALVPVTVAAHASGELLVDERRPFEHGADWLSQEADEALRLFVADPRSDATLVAGLRAAWQVRAALVKTNDEIRKATDEQAELGRATEETRDNLRALEKNKAAGELRQKLTDRLSRDSLRLDEVSKRLVELQMRQNEQRVQFNEAVRSLHYTSAPRPGSAGGAG